MVAIYIDDILLIGNHKEEIAEIKSFLDLEFLIKKFGYSNYFLGMEILNEPGGLVVTQQMFAIDLLNEYDCLTSICLNSAQSYIKIFF